jgi:hypothetical protein
MPYEFVDEAPKGRYEFVDEPAKPKGSVALDAAGAVLRGAGSIGATLLSPIDAAARALNQGKPVEIGGIPLIGVDRRKLMDDFMKSHNVDTESLTYKGTKLGTEALGTAGVGGVLGKVAMSLGASAPVAQALTSGGLIAQGASLPTRMLAGAATGAATAGLANPEDVQAGAVVGAGIPLAGKLGGVAGQFVRNKLDDSAYGMMRSALKPVLKAQQTGDADVAVRTMLDRGLNATQSGVNKLRGLVDDVNTQISDRIAGSNALIAKDDVLRALGDTRSKFANQVSPGADLSAIDAVQMGFMQHPNLPGATIPVQQAQAMKQGTYKVLSNKYGQLGSAETEAQKSLARGLKDEIAKAVPEVSALNAEEAALIKTLKVAERRVLMDMNKNPMGLAALANNPVSWAAFMADRSSAFKSVAARMANSASKTIESNAGLLSDVYAHPLMRSGLLLSQGDR